VSHPEELKRNLLHFVSSELTSHAASIVGLSVLLFTCINVFARDGFLPRLQFSHALYISKTTFDYVIAFLAFWTLNTGIFYSFMRLTYYGAFAHETIILEDFTPNSLESLRKHVAGEIKGVTSWFSGGLSWKSDGSRLSLLVGLAISLVLFVVLFVE
jgi:hypothetical protein